VVWPLTNVVRDKIAAIYERNDEMKWFLCFAVTLGLACNTWAGVVNFADLALAPNSYWNGSDNSGGFTSGGVTFANSFMDWGGGSTSWSGFSYSNVNDTATPGFGNQYAAYPGTAPGGGGIYAVGCVSLDWMTNAPIPIVATLQTPSVLGTVAITNATYAALSMKYGDSFAKKFGGPTGNDPDWFLLTINGEDAAGNQTGSVNFYLADYCSANKYIVDTWQTVDLSSLGTVKTLEFTLSSSDNGQFGMNTPAYFALDDLTVVPEPGTTILLVLGATAILRRRRM
jgi:hypothetical protein